MYHDVDILKYVVDYVYSIGFRDNYKPKKRAISNNMEKKKNGWLGPQVELEKNVTAL